MFLNFLHSTVNLLEWEAEIHQKIIHKFLTKGNS